MDKTAEQLIREFQKIANELRKKVAVQGFPIKVTENRHILTDTPLPEDTEFYIEVDGDVRAYLSPGSPNVYYFNERTAQWESLIDGAPRK